MVLLVREGVCVCVCVCVWVGVCLVWVCVCVSGVCVSGNGCYLTSMGGATPLCNGLYLCTHSLTC